MNESEILINGVTLTEGESMTVRVAIQNFAMSLQENGLGNDRHGEMMTLAYLANIDKINRFMQKFNFSSSPRSDNDSTNSDTAGQ